jgi:hypothetical protein
MRIFLRTLEAAGIDRVDRAGKKLDIHALRHTVASRMARNGVGMAQAQKVLGHASIEMTARVTASQGRDRVAPSFALTPPSPQSGTALIECVKASLVQHADRIAKALRTDPGAIRLLMQTFLAAAEVTTQANESVMKDSSPARTQPLTPSASSPTVARVAEAATSRSLGSLETWSGESARSGSGKSARSACGKSGTGGTTASPRGMTTSR